MDKQIVRHECWRQTWITVFWILVLNGMVTLPAVTVGENNPHSSSQSISNEIWTFVSFPDFFNFDIPNPWPQWDPAVNWFLDQVETENPEFVLIAGDLVNGHWYDGPKCIEQMGALYYSGWIRRMKEHNLKFYVAVGDHELGDDPWPKEKILLLPHFERVFAKHMEMPANGPVGKEGLAYYFVHKNVLIITVETFEQHHGEIHATVSGDQLKWFKNVLHQYRDKVDEFFIKYWI